MVYDDCSLLFLPNKVLNRCRFRWICHWSRGSSICMADRVWISVRPCCHGALSGHLIQCQPLRRTEWHSGEPGFLGFRLSYRPRCPVHWVLRKTVPLCCFSSVETHTAHETEAFARSTPYIRPYMEFVFVLQVDVHLDQRAQRSLDRPSNQTTKFYFV